MITEEKRLYVFEKYDGRCAYCGCELTMEFMTIDHIIPKALNGSDFLCNLNPSCKYCNGLKGDLPYKEFVMLVRQLVEKGQFKQYFRADNPNTVFYSRQIHKERTLSVKKCLQSSLVIQPKDLANVTFTIEDIKERRAEALVTQYCMDYGINISIFLAIHAPKNTLLYSTITAVKPFFEKQEEFPHHIYSILAYDVSKINDPELLRLEKELLADIPNISPMKLLRIENLYILDKSRSA